jgi:hypothetical protein
MMEPAITVPIAKCLRCGRVPFGRAKIETGPDGKRYACCSPSCYDTNKRIDEARERMRLQGRTDGSERR